MTYTPELFDTREQEYEVASWLSILPIMRSVGDFHAKRKDQSEGLGYHALRICSAIQQKPDHLIANVQQWASSGRTDKQRVNTLKQLGIINKDTSLSQDFVDAYEIFTDHGLQVYLTANASFGRLISITSELEEHYEPQVRESIKNRTDFMYTFANVKRDIDFYIGLYDPHR